MCGSKCKNYSGQLKRTVFLQVVPEGFRELLKWVKNKYNNPSIIITENGYGDIGELDDSKRLSYYKVLIL